MPRVSVIIPTYDRCEWVQRAIDSVLAQTYVDHEVIVVDDGSTDGTGEMLRARYGGKINYKWQENQGESVARNHGVALAQGEYIALLDSDDTWMPDKLAKQVVMLDADPDAALIFCQAWLMDAAGCRLNCSPLGHNLEPGETSVERLCIENTVVAASTVLIRRLAMEQVGGFDPGIRFGEDWDLWLRLRVNWNFLFLPEPLASIRVHTLSQCHLPRPENIERVLNDHVSLLEKAFTAWPGSPETLAVVRKRSLARQYAQSAFASYAWGHWKQGGYYLGLALTLDPASWRDEERLAAMLINHGVAIAEIEGCFQMDRLHAYLDGVFSHWPEEARISTQAKRRVWAQLCAEASYRAYLSGNRRLARYFAWHAFLADYSLLKDIGFVKRFLTGAA